MNYGKLSHGDHRGKPSWFIDPVPHVAARIKRIFPRISVFQRGTLVVSDTLETAVDIEWVLSRWPMLMDTDVAERLTHRASAYRESRDTVTRILEGYIPPDAWQETAVPLRTYQLEAAALAHETGMLLLCDELGLGKTASTLAVLRDPDALPAVVVCLTHLPTQWANEVRKFLPWLTPHVIPTGPVYDPLAGGGTLFGNKADVLIVPYSRLVKWADYLRGNVNAVIFDEMQELRHTGTAKYTAADMIAREATWIQGATATPVYNYGDEIHHIVSILTPDALGTEEEFKREWCVQGYGKPRVADPAALGTYLRDMGIMLRRERSEVGRELPDVIRVTHTIDVDQHKLDELTSDAVKLAEQIFEATGTNFDLMKASGDFDWRVRHATGVAKAGFVAEFTRLLLESGEAVVLFGWHRSCFAPGTMVLMADGTTKAIEDVVIGDLVMGPDSQSRAVLSLAHGRGSMHRVVPTKGESWTCSEYHTLAVYNSWRKTIDRVTVHEYMAKSDRWKRDRLLFRAEAVLFPDQSPTVEPWLLGYWLGDGAASLKDLRVSSKDPEIREECERIAARNGLRLSVWDSKGMHGNSECKQLCFSSGLNGPKNRNRLVASFRSLGLHNAKHIPQRCLTASINDRREILAGMIDSDGHVYVGTGVGSADIGSVDPLLADQIASLARSLGLAAYVKIKSRQPGGLSMRPMHVVTISGDLTTLPTRITRKRAGQRSGQKNVLRTGFKIEPVGMGDYYGFEVDGDHLFLLADYTVVHNCYDIWLERLADHRPAMYTGSESAAKKLGEADRFLSGDTDLLLMSLRAGAGLDGLQERSKVAVFGELDWSPGVHAQAIGRLHRDGQTDSVLAYFLVADSGSDPVVAEVLNLKRQQSDPIIDPNAAVIETVDQTDRVKNLAREFLAQRQ